MNLWTVLTERRRRKMSNFEIAEKIDKLNDEIDKAIGIMMILPLDIKNVAKARKIAANVSAELSNLVDELNREG